MTDPAQLTPLERNWDEVLRFENFARYAEQSRQTQGGQVAELPARDAA